jgi:hypothetical protein
MKNFIGWAALALLVGSPFAIAVWNGLAFLSGHPRDAIIDRADDE